VSTPENTVPPAISGTPGIGNTLTCSTGTWILSSGRSFRGGWWTTPLASKTPVTNSSDWITNLVSNGVTGAYVNTHVFTAAWATGIVGTTPGWAYGTVYSGDDSYSLADVPLDASWVTPHAYDPTDTDNQFMITDEGTDISYEVGGADPGLIAGPNWNAGPESGGTRPFPLGDDGWVNQQNMTNGIACNAAGCSSLGGMMFSDEINAGPTAIPHRLICTIPGNLIRGPSNDPDYPGELQDSGAYINPATRSDGSAGQFTDNIPMGSIFTFPDGFDITTISTDPYWLGILGALYDSGAVLVNSAGGSTMTLYAPNVCSPSAPSYPSSIVDTVLDDVIANLIIVAPPAAPIYSS
jgi:hypothetical protein